MKTFYIILAALVLVIGGLFWLRPRPAPLDGFTKCLEEKGAKFYGAFWCTHCQNQKKLFGRSARKLPYIECSTADGKGQLQICKDKKVDSYPTWEFADGTRIGGEVSLQRLAEKTGCVLPATN